MYAKRISAAKKSTREKLIFSVLRPCFKHKRDWKYWTNKQVILCADIDRWYRKYNLFCLKLSFFLQNPRRRMSARMVRIIELKSTKKNCKDYTLFYQLSIFVYYVRNEFLKSIFFPIKSRKKSLILHV